MGKLSVVRVGVLVISAQALFLLVGGSMWAQNAVNAYLKIEGIDGESKDAAHMNWIPIASVVAGDLDGDGMADRESSAPSVSELTASEQASRKATGTTASGQTGQASTAGSPSMVRESPTKASTGKTSVRESPTLASTSAIQSPRDIATGQASGKRMHKPLVITKEVDKSSPLLMKAMQSGRLIREIDVDLGHPTAHNATGRFRLTNVMISSIQQAGHGGGGGSQQMESVSFNYQKIEMK
jgi:type VI secretion system secreted protein Hcp